MEITALARLRRGEKMNVRAETLARLAQAMGRSCDELLGLTPPDPLGPKCAELEEAVRQRDEIIRGLQRAFQALPVLRPDGGVLRKPRRGSPPA